MKRAQCPPLRSIVSSSLLNQPTYGNLLYRLQKFSSPSPPCPATTWAIAGATLSLTSAGLLQAAQPTQTYEGTVRFATSTDASVVPEAATEKSTGAAVVTQPLPSGQAQIQSWQHADLLDLARQLPTQGEAPSDRDLLRNLRVQLHAEAGTLEVHYRGTSPDQVYQVLEHLAQSYATVGPDCYTQSCQTLRFTEAQIAATEQRLQQLAAEVDGFQQRYGFHQPESRRRAIAQTSQVLRQQQRQLASQIETARRDLQRQNALMGLASDDPAANLQLHESYSYRAALEQWQRLDFELALAYLQQSPDPAQITVLRLEQQRLAHQLHQEVAKVAQMPVSMMATPIFAVVDASPSRQAYLESFFNQGHRLNLLIMRQAVLTRLEQKAANQMTQWRALSERYEKLQGRIQDAKTVLAAHRSQVAALQRHQEQRADWQLVAAPKLRERQQPLDWSGLRPATSDNLLSLLLILGTTVALVGSSAASQQVRYHES
ncbi:MAG: hypothetical protein ACFB8W_02485 [Elainellaceae cyanobacterium]